MTAEIVKRVALLKLAEDEAQELTFQEWLKDQPASGMSDPISERIYPRLRSKLGPMAIPFFQLYGQTRLMMEGAPPPEEGLVQAWKNATKGLTRVLAAKLGDQGPPQLINSIFDRMTAVRPVLRKIEQGYGLYAFRTAGDQISQVIADVCRAVGLPVTIRPGVDAAKWPLVRRSSEKEQQLDRLKADNPSLYAQIVEGREKLRKIDIQVVESIQRAGLLPTKTKIRGRLVNLGVDPVTNERMVYTNDGRVVSVEQFSQEMVEGHAVRERSSKIFPNGLPKGGKTDPSLEGLRILTDVQVSDPDVIPQQEIIYRALTDDLAAEGGTRVYPTKIDAKGRPVVIDGRFKGIYLDDLVNRAGRLIEGAAFDFDARGKMVRFETKNPDGSPNLAARKEPYVTVTADGRLMVKVPFKGKNDPFTSARQEMDRLARPTRIPTIEKVAGTMNTTFIFPEKDYAAVRRAVGGMVLSKAAADKLKAYFDQLERQERALTEEATKSYTLSAIGGFKIEALIDPASGLPYDPPRFKPDLFGKQKEAISWAESKGYRGLLALDTGIGKTLTSIATMKKMERDGFAQDGTRFLYICPTKLRGNFAREARASLQEAGAFLSKVDVISYQQFARKRKENPKFGTVDGDPAAGVPPYVAVFFDEAHVLVKNPSSVGSRAALSLKHPRKILLTASPMEDDPDELYIGVAITNNIDLNERGPDGGVSPAVRDMMRFRSRFCQTVGGRTLGLKAADAEDPTKTEDFYAWAKSNFYAANKRDVVEKPLPELRRESKTITMDPAVETIYREEAQKVAEVLKAAVTVFRDKGKVRSDQVRDLFGMKLRKSLATLNDLSNMPALLIPGSRSPKVEASAEIVVDRISRGGRTILFTDSPKFAEYTVLELSVRVPSLLHAVALSGEIAVYQNGRKIAKYGQRIYRNKDGVEIPKQEWASFVLREIIGADQQVSSLVLTSGYSFGQNLQMFSTVVHLDRDGFSSETMKQRTARAWRTGQDSAVDEITLDMAYNDTESTTDSTLDEVRRYIQEVQETLFNEIVGKSQAAAIGKEWSEMANVDASLVAVNRKLVEMTLAPLAAAMGEADAAERSAVVVSRTVMVS